MDALQPRSQGLFPGLGPPSQGKDPGNEVGCTWEVWRALKKLELLSPAPRATLTLLSCSPNFPRASITQYTHAKHEPILNHRMSKRTLKNRFSVKD